MKRQVTIGFLFILGCATGGAVAQLAVPPVRAGTDPTRWEYNCISSEAGTINSDLNKMGGQGWELASGFAAHYQSEFANLKADAYGFCFKRALP